MADTFYATLELKNIRMDGFLFSFPGKYRHNAIFCDRIWPKQTYEFLSQWHFNLFRVLDISLSKICNVALKFDSLDKLSVST